MAVNLDKYINQIEEQERDYLIDREETESISFNKRYKKELRALEEKPIKGKEQNIKKKVRKMTYEELLRMARPILEKNKRKQQLMENEKKRQLNNDLKEAEEQQLVQRKTVGRFLRRGNTTISLKKGIHRATTGKSLGR